MTEADTIYRIDRMTEGSVSGMVRWPLARTVAGHLVMEGLEDHTVRSSPSEPAGKRRLKIIVDPIDGTRGLIHDKRPAWVLTGVAPIGVTAPIWVT